MCLVVRMRWTNVYEDHYVPAMVERSLDPASYNQFVQIRKKHRPYYKKHRKVSRKSWNHLECGECVRLQSAIDKAKNPECKELFQDKLDAHIAYQAQFRSHYEEQVEKVLNHNRNTDGAKDIIMQIDGSGPSGTKFCPYYPEDILSGENAAYQNLKTSNTFAMVHGWGRIVFQSYPMLESQGSNLVIEIIFRVIRIVMQDRDYSKLRNVYIFLDNAAYNKSHVLIAALCSLVLLGICRKVKVGYLLVSHTHCDNDAEIGTAGNHLCEESLPSFEVFEQQVLKAFRGGGNTKVERIVGVTDFKSMFTDIDRNRNQIKGLSLVHAIRITARPGALPSETGVDVFYKIDFTDRESWFPMPAPRLPGVGNFNAIFHHAEHGAAVSCTNAFGVVERRQRQQWMYEILYGSGKRETFRMACMSLPYELSRESILMRLQNSSRQKQKKTFMAKLRRIRRSIKATLRNRCDEKHWPSHDQFFKSLPRSEHEVHPTYYNALSHLMTHYGGGVVFPPVAASVPCDAQASDYICPITFRNGPVSAAEREKVLTELELHKPLQKRRKKKKGAAETDDSDSDKADVQGRLRDVHPIMMRAIHH